MFFYKLKKYKLIALEIVQQIPKPLCVVHVRRGDYLNIHKTLHTTTSPENIILNLVI